MLLLVPILALVVAFALWRSGHRWASLGCLGSLVVLAGVVSLLYLIMSRGSP